MYTFFFFLGKHVIETNPSTFDERLFSDIYLCRLRLKQGRATRDFMLRERQRQRDRERETEKDRERKGKRETESSWTS